MKKILVFTVKQNKLEINLPKIFKTSILKTKTEN